MNYHQIGTATHREYEAKYSIPNTVYDQKAEAKGLPLKVVTVASVIGLATLLTIISVLV
ncbi:MAG: hypothetical protein AAF902_07415 [Chloroflexota bacterium]